MQSYSLTDECRGSSSDADLQASLDAIADLRAQLTTAKTKLNESQLDLVASDSQLNDAQQEIADLHIQLAVSCAVSLQVADFALTWQNANKSADKDSGHLPLIAQLKTEVEANLNMIADLQDKLNKQHAQLVRPLVHRQLLQLTLLLQDKQDNGLTSDFDFGRRVYQCTVPNPGVGYRHTPQFADKVLASA